MQVSKRVIIKFSCKGLGSNSGTNSCHTKDSKQDFMIKVPASVDCNNHKDECMPDSDSQKMSQQTNSCVTDDSEPDVKVKAPPTSCASSKRKAETALDAQRLMRRKMDHGRVLYVTDNTESDMKSKVLSASDCNERKPVSMIDSERLKRRKMDRGVKLKCSHILRELTMQKYGWVFSKPVDPVALNIPNYFDVISNPMDLGTIRLKLEDNKYSYAEEFASDVYLTFSNAMEYNPPDDNVHYWAKQLDGMFRSKWKLLVHKWNHESSGVEQGIRQNESLSCGNDGKNACSEQPSLNSTNEVKQSMTREEKTRLWKELLSLINGKISEKLRTTLKNLELTSLIEEGKFNVDVVNDIEDSAWLELRRYIKAAMVVSAKTANTGRCLLPAVVVHKGSDGGKCVDRNKSGFCSPNNKSFRDQQRPERDQQQHPETRVDAGKKNASVHASTSNQDIAKKALQTQGNCSSLGVAKKVMPTHVASSDSNAARKSVPAPEICSNSNAARKRVPAPEIRSNSNAARKRVPAPEIRSNSHAARKSASAPEISSNSNAARKSAPAPEIISNSNAARKRVPAPATSSNLNVAKDDLPAHATTSDQDSICWTRLDDQSSLEKAQRAAMLKSRFADTILKATVRSDPKRLQEEKERLERLQLEEEAKIKSVLEEQVRKQTEKARRDYMTAMEMMERRSMIENSMTDNNMMSFTELERLCGVPPSYTLYADIYRRHLEHKFGLVLKEDDCVEDEDEYLYGDREEGEI